MGIATRPFFAGLASAALLLPGAALGQELPPDEAAARDRLNDSPRHGEWVRFDAGGGDTVEAWIVYPQRDDPAPVVVVIHEIFGLTDWIRAVADQVAAEGYIAIAPDLLYGHGPGGAGTNGFADQDAVRAAIRELDREDVNQRLIASAEYAMDLASAAPRAASVGFCWGGTSSFELAVAWPELDGAVVYYGSSPDAASLAAVEAPVLGLYGGEDNRVNATIPAAREALAAAGKEYTALVLDGAGHGFLRNQPGMEGANLEATRQAWPATVAFFRRVLGE